MYYNHLANDLEYSFMFIQTPKLTRMCGKRYIKESVTDKYLPFFLKSPTKAVFSKLQFNWLNSQLDNS